MLPLLTYYSYNCLPNDEELKCCINIASKQKGPVLLFFASSGMKDTDVNHVFIHEEDTIESVKLRISAGYKII